MQSPSPDVGSETSCTKLHSSHLFDVVHGDLSRKDAHLESDSDVAHGLDVDGPADHPRFSSGLIHHDAAVDAWQHASAVLPGYVLTSVGQFWQAHCHHQA